MMSNLNLARKNSLSEAVKERRLRPLYELLDTGNNKKVIQEADRLLKKQPGLMCAKVLKGLAFLRMGKKEDCMALLNPVFEEVPIDESTIQALSICYRELDKPELVCQLLENACKKDKSEDLLTVCFMAHTRVGDYQKQYQTAMSLYKLYPKVPYFSWAIMSLYIKALSDPVETADRMTLPLAERMMAKFIVDNKINTEHELSLYLLILMRQRNYEIAYRVMDTFSKKGVSWRTGTLPKMMSTCLRETKQNDKLMEFYESMMQARLDEWEYFYDYVKEFGKTVPEKVSKFLKGVMHHMNMDETVTRCCLLSRMLLFKLLQLESKGSGEYESEFFDALYEYVRTYGGKPFFFFDIGIFLACIKSEKERTVLIELASCVTMFTQSKIERIQRNMNATFLKHHYEYDQILSDPSKAIDCIGAYVKTYIVIREGIFDPDIPLDPKDGYPHDDYLTLASLILAESFWVPSNLWKGYYLSNDMRRFGLMTEGKEKNESVSSKSPVSSANTNAQDDLSIANGLPHLQRRLSDAVFNLPEDDFPVLLCMALLEYGLERSQSCSQMRVLLGKVYTLCGAVVAGTDQFMRLDIKHAQIESLGYLYLWKTVSSGVLGDALRVLNHADTFYTSHHKESVEHILSAYKYGSWEKIIEFMEFRGSILRSTQGSMVKVEMRLLEYTREVQTHDSCLQVAQRDEYDAKAEIFDVAHFLQENRDFGLLSVFRKEKVSDELRDLTFQDDLIRLKIRGSFLSLLNSFVLLIVDTKDDTKFNNRIAYIEELMGLVDDIVSKDFKEFDVSQSSIDGPWGPKMFQLKSIGFLDILFGCLNTLLKIAKEPSVESVPSMIESLEQQVTKTVKQRLKEWGAMKFLLINFLKLNEEVFSVIEALGFCCILSDVLKCLLQRQSSNAGKSKKKKAKDVETSLESAWIPSFNNLVKTLRGALTEIEEHISEFKFASGEFYPGTWAEQKGMWKGKASDEILNDVLPSVMPNIMDKLNTSYYRAYSEMKLNAMSKRKYAESLIMSSANQ